MVFSTAIEGATAVLREADYDAVLYSLPDSSTPRQAFNADVLRNRVDGVLVISLPFSEEEARSLRRLSVPAVFISVFQPGFHQVGIDDPGAAQQAAELLIQLGHQRIGHIAGSGEDANPHSPTTGRRKGWKTALDTAHLDSSPTFEESSDLTIEGGRQAAMTLLSRHPDLTAIMASSDEAAMGAIEAITNVGKYPGQDISIIGIDGHDLAAFAGLSTVAQPVLKQGKAAAQLLLDLVNESSSTTPQRIDFTTQLIQRASTGVLRAH